MRGSAPRKMFSATLMFGASINSWKTIEMPFRAASLVLEKCISSPSKTSRPEVGK